MSTPHRLPIVNSDDGTWGDILRLYMMKEHYDDGTDNFAENGGHKTVTIRAGTASAGTAPLKFTSGTLLTTPEAGAVEFNTDTLYFTQTTSTTRKKVAAYDDSSGATGDIYYRDSSGYFVRLGIGSSGNVLTVSGGLPSWQAPTGGGGASLPVTDNTAIVENTTDTTKQLKFDLSGLTTATTRTLTVPDANTTIVGTDATQTLTNKTISGSSNTLSNIALSSLSTTGTANSTTFLRGDGAWTAAYNAVYTANVGDGTSTSYVITHNLGTRSVAISIYDASTYEEVECDKFRTTVNSVTLTFASAPATNAYVCVITNGSLSTTINSTDVADSTVTGRSLMTAASATAARTAISAISATSTDTLQNKTISGASNTLTNIGISSISATGTASSSTYLRGDGSWSSPTSSSGAFISRRNTASVSLTAGGSGQTLPASFWDHTSTNTSDITVDLTNGKFTVSVAGWYIVNAVLNAAAIPSVSGSGVNAILYKNGSITQQAPMSFIVIQDGGSPSYFRAGSSVPGTFIISLAASDYLQIGYYATNAGFALSGEATDQLCYYSIARMNPQ